jgi:Transposase DDE domain
MDSPFTSAIDWPQLRSRLPSGLDLDALAKSTKALRRRRKVDSGETLLRLALGYGPCGQSLRESAAWAENEALVSFSDVALLKRLRRSGAFLEEIVQSLLRERCDPLPHSLADMRRRVVLIDASCVSQPGSHSADWRLHARYDLGTGRFCGLELTDGRKAEKLERHSIASGDMIVADRGNARAEGFLHVINCDADFLVRAGWNSTKLHHRDGAKLDLPTQFAKLAASGDVLDIPVGISAKTAMILARLIIKKKDPEATDRAVKRVRRKAQQNSAVCHGMSELAAGYVILLTSADLSTLSADNALALYRYRWQIEIAFKRLKSILHLDRLPAKTEELARTWLNAHLVLALILEDITQQELDFPP